MNPSIAIVGMACIYPDARTPGELWENALAQRRAFRRIPPERLRLEDYFSPKAQRPETTYATQAAVIEGYEFDRVAFRVVGSTFRSADLTHWLALDVAGRALADAGFPDGQGLPRAMTGVLLGNSLTGEFSRANLLRLRWPYVRRVVDATLRRQGMTAPRRAELLASLEADYKAPFPPMGDESLAGGLSNTIAGRICNQFDLKGGGYTVDGACASSLLATANACSALAAGDLDVALAGGVDLSLDPFEIIGFSQLGALAAEEMRVFDQRSAGFWPGEGCGFVVLMRHDDALAQGRRVYAVIRGWGISSDGHGGITRPEADGQLEALRRAYRRAGFGADTVTYYESHGTGTTVGDATELEVLSRVRREGRPDAPPAFVGSIKANIGHTKAAAGLAGLLKATMAVHTQVLPPTTGCEQPHPLLTGPAPALRVLREPEVWPADRPLRASVSAMGFGGINAHVVLEGIAAGRRTGLSGREQSLARTQDAELFLFAAATGGELLQQVELVLALAGRISRAELVDLAAELGRRAGAGAGAQRAAVVASRPAELAERLRTLAGWLKTGTTAKLGMAEQVFVGAGGGPPRMGFLFPGQASPAHLDGGAWVRRFGAVRALYDRADLPRGADAVSTRVAQPAIVTASRAGLLVLEELGVDAGAAIGHSLGEITALHWAGVFDEGALRQIASVRGAAMADLGSPTGAMAAIAAASAEVRPLLTGVTVTIVGYNSPRQTVVAGEATEVAEVARRARARGWPATLLPVSHAFHTPLVAGATPVLAAELEQLVFERPRRTVFSTVTGNVLLPDENLRDLLCRQVTSLVRFSAALEAMLEADGAFDLLLEVGPGAVLSGLVRDATDVPVVSLDAGGVSLHGLLQAVGAAFALGAPVKPAALFSDRFARPFTLDWKPRFFANPCELAPLPEEGAVAAPASQTAPADPPDQPNPRDLPASGELPALELVRQLVAERAELPVEAVRDDSRMLSDLHLNSITVGQLVSEAAKRLGLARIVGLTDFADASVTEVARALEELQRTGSTAQQEDQRRQPPGVDVWFHSFQTEWVEAKLPARRAAADKTTGRWRIIAPENHPLAAELSGQLARWAGHGVLLCLPEHPTEEMIPWLLEAARAVAALKDPAREMPAPNDAQHDPTSISRAEMRFVVVQHGWGGAGFAKTLHLESHGLTTCVVNVPPGVPQAADWILHEVTAASGFSEARYDAQGKRFEPRLKWLPPVADASASSSKPDENKSSTRTQDEEDFPIGPEDVLLVTGGGKGIAAECALALGRETGCKLVLLGRSDPTKDKELAGNLERIRAAGIRCHYGRADVTDAAAVQSAVALAQQALGPVTAFLHGAGTNAPQLISALEESAFRRTVAPKLHGARNVLAALDPARLRLFIAFGSIIARAGLRGEADYAAANEWMTAFTEDFQVRHPDCRCLALEWSVWSGVGMGERLGRIEALVAHGITPIPVDAGVRALLDAVKQPGGPVARVVTGRFGEPPTVKLAEPELPLSRFLEHKRAYYPGVELIVDAELSAATDPYLNDHVVQKEKLFPAVLGLEAMAQAAMALAGSPTAPGFEQVELVRPVAVSDPGTTTIRVAALRRGPGRIEVCLRSEGTDFQVDHFRALCRFDLPAGEATTQLKLGAVEPEALPLNPDADLYGGILFHRGRFQRVRGYRLLTARECVAELAPEDGAAWFGSYLPAGFVLGDPGLRDAALHAIQACIPHARILPTGIERIEMLEAGSGTRFVRAKERFRDENEFVYDLEVADANGAVVERWTGLRLRAVGRIAAPTAWLEPLVAPYVERRLEELLPQSAVKVVLQQGGRSRRNSAAVRRALGDGGPAWRRGDGKPETAGGANISTAHSQALTLGVISRGRVGCDLEEVTARLPEAWSDLLGPVNLQLAGRIAGGRAESFDVAATRLWSSLESLKKAGLPATAAFVLESVTPDGWVLLRSGSFTVATVALPVRSGNGPLVIALALEQEARKPGPRPAAVTAT